MLLWAIISFLKNHIPLARVSGRVKLIVHFPSQSLTSGLHFVCSSIYLKIHALFSQFGPSKHSLQMTRCPTGKGILFLSTMRVVSSTVSQSTTFCLLKVVHSFQNFAIRLIFCVTQPCHSTGNRQAFIYGDFFRFTGATGSDDQGGKTSLPVKHINMLSLRQHLRMDVGQTPISEIIALTNVLEIVQLVPRFGAVINKGWNCNNSLAKAKEFYLNNFANKNTFHAVLTYQ